MQADSTIITRSTAETESVGADFARRYQSCGGRFVAFYGDLGVGKTAFVRGMASYLCPDAFVHSPTFSIINLYKNEGKTALIHIDAYRISDEDDLISSGFYDCVEECDCMTVVEWSENVPFALPEHYAKVTISRGDDEDERKIQIDFGGKKC